MGITPAPARWSIRRGDATRRRWSWLRIAPFTLSRRGYDGIDGGPRILGALTFSAMPWNVADARRFLADVLAADTAELDTIILLACELIANSVRHAGGGPRGTITIAVLGLADGIRVEVADCGSPTTPCLRPDVDEFAEGGRGLRLVDALAARWGFTRDANGATTWFEVEGPCGDRDPG